MKLLTTPGYPAYELSTGKKVLTDSAIIGLSEGGVLTSGYERIIYGEFSPEEKREIADYMISKWTRFKESNDPSIRKEAVTL